MNDYSPTPTPSTIWLSGVLGAIIGGIIGLVVGGLPAIPLALVGFVVGLVLGWAKRQPKPKGTRGTSR